MSNPLTYEQAYAQLEEIVARLNSGALTLDETVALYARGRELSDYCRSLLDAAELKIIQLDPHADEDESDEDVADEDDDGYKSPPPDLLPKRPNIDTPF
ncbi:MAG: exodeoxyribonuclease VII small subunit [Anaerolineae bacterium]